MKPNHFYRYRTPVLYFSTLFLFIAACKSKTPEPETVTPATYTANTPAPVYHTNTEETEPYQPNRYEYPDGNYCATVKYSNSNTGTHSLYVLNVEVADGKLSKITFPNGGWLDESHFDPPAVARNGYTEFINDRGYYYQVLIEHTGSCSSGEQVINNLPAPSPYSSYEDDDNEIDDDEEDEEKQTGKETGVVVKRFDNCDYFIAETRKGLVVLEWMGGYDPEEGDKIRGELNHYGTKDYYIINKDRTSRFWLDDYMLSEENALQKAMEKCH